jgi:hypothetical protein
LPVRRRPCGPPLPRPVPKTKAEAFVPSPSGGRPKPLLVSLSDPVPRPDRNPVPSRLAASRSPCGFQVPSLGSGKFGLSLLLPSPSGLPFRSRRILRFRLGCSTKPATLAKA